MAIRQAAGGLASATPARDARLAPEAARMTVRADLRAGGKLQRFFSVPLGSTVVTAAFWNLTSTLSAISTVR